ncbi:2-hydroxy-3-oxopropionate reductase [Arvimicrobium flavum]|uniref:2-hydroxy-3-oxopropionate reductase n=1 Tax=Arvimicrobium flavum TaxID=3393320 RepID=UPI00237BA830|nr:2-hydroxy-3-oxopropionate reductase [Mesorhizobium shangrilense]
MDKIGFIGLGIMGAPMAGHLLDAGYEVITTDHRSKPHRDLTAKGLKAVTGNRAVAAATDFVVLMVPDTPQVEDVLLGENGAISGLSPGKLVIDMSSISPIATKEFAKKVEATGAHYLDAPVSGGEVGAKAASLTIMVGGPEHAFERARPVFEKMGKNITLVGGNGVGQTTKVANQIVVALTIEAVAEALVFASKAGADPAKVRQALMGGLAASRILEVHGERMIKRTFAPGFRIELHQKDLNLALEGARSLGVALPNTSTTQQLFSACVANGGAKEDHSALVKALELMAGNRVGE